MPQHSIYLVLSSRYALASSLIKDSAAGLTVTTDSWTDAQRKQLLAVLFVTAKRQVGAVMKIRLRQNHFNSASILTARA